MTPTDPLGALLQHFSAEARLFFSGQLCGGADFDAAGGAAYLHLMRGGRARLNDASGFATELDRPSVVFYSRPLSHHFHADIEQGADFVCASVRFSHAAFNPIVTALPARLVRPLDALPTSAPLLGLLFSEAFGERQGRQEVLNRLFEVVLIELLRSYLAEAGANAGLLRGLGHPQLARALDAMHTHPAHAWTLDALATEAAMSRAAFAANFKEVIGSTPGDYLTRWRISVAQALLREGLPLKLVAERVGYASQPGFLRAFKAVVGSSPTAWKRAS